MSSRQRNCDGGDSWRRHRDGDRVLLFAWRRGGEARVARVAITYRNCFSHPCLNCNNKRSNTCPNDFKLFLIESLITLWSNLLEEDSHSLLLNSHPPPPLLAIPSAAAEANFTELAIVDFFKSKDAVLPLSSNLDDLFCHITLLQL